MNLAHAYHTPVSYWLDPDTDPHLIATAVAMLEESDDG